MLDYFDYYYFTKVNLISYDLFYYLNHYYLLQNYYHRLLYVISNCFERSFYKINCFDFLTQIQIYLHFLDSKTHMLFL